MNLKNGIFALASTLALALGGCSFSETPELSDFKLSTNTTTPGTDISATAMVQDDDGDLSGGKMVVTIKAGSIDDRREVPINLGGDTSKAALSLSLSIAKTAPKGVATITLMVIDKEGHSSNSQSAELTIE